MQITSSLVAFSVIAALSTATCASDEEASQLHPVLLALNYQDNVDIEQYWQSEKLDGIRAVWDGKQLRTRNGHPIFAPDWFTQPLPDYPLEGELWAGRGNFHIVQQTVLDQQPKDVAWRLIEYRLFDIPYSTHHYPHRYQALMDFVTHADEQHIKLIEHTPISSLQQLFDDLDQVVEQSGEGLMLRKTNGHYRGGRHADLLKLKKHQDAEAKVVGYKFGNGKFSNMMGALLVQLPSGQQFYLGNGFSNEQRRNPPPLGSTITYRFNGYTHNGVPKFARFLRLRIEL